MQSIDGIQIDFAHTNQDIQGRVFIKHASRDWTLDDWVYHTEHALEACKRYDIPKIVFISEAYKMHAIKTKPDGSSMWPSKTKGVKYD
jgi:hypothetical protein